MDYFCCTSYTSLQLHPSHISPQKLSGVTYCYPGACVNRLTCSESLGATALRIVTHAGNSICREGSTVSKITYTSQAHFQQVELPAESVRAKIDIETILNTVSPVAERFKVKIMGKSPTLLLGP